MLERNLGSFESASKKVLDKRAEETKDAIDDEEVFEYIGSMDSRDPKARMKSD